MDFLIHHMLRTSAQHWAEKEALVHGDQRLSYREDSPKDSGMPGWSAVTASVSI
jgi:non-ribosomal peptide synthetase component E (peptide arylation enzyme)